MSSFKRGKDLKKKLRRVLHEHGVKHQRFGTTGGNHQEVVFELAGREERFCFSSTPGRAAYVGVPAQLKRFIQERLADG